jgi:RNA polymerase sigma-70 factor (ECF subfamily)
MVAVPQGAALPVGREADTLDASEVKRLLEAGLEDEARERFAEIVLRHQRRASRIAYHYLRDAADADEAVQDAFVKAYLHLDTFREELPFEVWFTRILVNGCLDRIKARARRDRWFVQRGEHVEEGQGVIETTAASGPSPEQALLARERHRRLNRALGRLPDRQRLVFVMSQVEGCSSKDVSVATGLNKSTVRVHLFRAIRRLRKLLAEPPEVTGGTNRAVR